MTFDPFVIQFPGKSCYWYRALAISRKDVALYQPTAIEAYSKSWAP